MKYLYRVQLRHNNSKLTIGATYKTGFKASEVEDRVLNYLRSDLQLNSYLSKERMPQKGHTETFGLDNISVEEVHALIENIRKKQLNRLLLIKKLSLHHMCV
jgi:hypothetical protein